MESKIEEFIEEDQFGFWKGKGTRDAIELTIITSEGLLDVKEKMCVCFIDCQKAKLLEMLKNIGVKWREHRLIYNLYMGRLKLCLNQGEIDSVETGKVSNRDVACHSHYLAYIKNISRRKHQLKLEIWRLEEELLIRWDLWIDTAIITKTQAELQDIVNRLVDSWRKYGMEININKS